MKNAHVTFRRRRFRLRFRGVHWHLDFQADGTRIRTTLRAETLELAKLRALDFLQQWHKNRLNSARAHLGTPRPIHLRTFLDVVSGLPLSCHPNTRLAYLNALYRVATTAAGSEDGVLSRPLPEILSPGTVRAYLRHVQTLIDTASTQEMANRHRRTANSTLNQVKALFAPHHLGHYRDANLPLPDLTPFLTEIRALKFRDATKREWHPPDEHVIQRTLAAWRQSWPSDRNLYLAFWLELACGLRRGEVSQARWDWIQDHQLYGKAHVKNGTGELRVTPIEPWWSEGLARLDEIPPEQRQSQEFILTGPPSERQRRVFERISRLLRAAGWCTTKTNHAVRALAGSFVARDRGLYAAKKFLRHSSVTITERHYVWALPD